MSIDLRKTPLQIFNRSLVRLKYIQQIQSDLNVVDAEKINQKINFLNQSYIFHLIGLWEDFIETLASQAFEDVQKLENEHRLDSVLKSNLESAIKRFNTPNTRNIDKLFNQTLGIKKITLCWDTKEFTRDTAKERLQNILYSRHQIAHKGRTHNNICYQSNFDDMNFIQKLAELLQNKIDHERGIHVLGLGY